MLISDADLTQFKEQGYFITDVMFDAATLSEMKSEFDRLWQDSIANAEAAGDAQSIELARLRPFIGQVHTQSEACARFVRAPIYQEVCAKLVGPDADLYYNQAVMKPPDKGRAFAWHQDSGYHLTDPLEYVTCWTAIADTTIENGTIWIVPGMHKNGVLPHEWSAAGREWELQFDDSAKIPVELKAGQIAIFSSLLPHCSGPNVSQTTRYAYVPQYHSAHLISKKTGEPWGDQFPVLRGGVPVTG